MKLFHNKRLGLTIACAVVVTLLWGWLNLRVRVVSPPDGLIFLTDVSTFSSPTRLQRVQGWPRDAYARTNWATISKGVVSFDEDARPKESNVNFLSFAINFATFFILQTIVYLLASAWHTRQFSLRSFLGFVFCCALLMVLVGPLIKSEYAHRKRDRELELWNRKFQESIKRPALP